MLPVDDFEWVEDIYEFGESFVKTYNEQSDERFFLDNDVQYPEKLHELHNDIPFLPEWLKIKKGEKLVANLHDKAEYVIHIKNVKTVLNHGLVFIKFNKV